MGLSKVPIVADARLPASLQQAQNTARIRTDVVIQNEFHAFGSFICSATKRLIPSR